MEAYYWTIQYNDGSIENQVEGVIEKKLDFKSLELRKPFIFSLIPTKEFLPKIQVLIDKDKRLIYFRRRVGCMNLATGENKLIKTIYAYGWQQTINGASVKNISWIDPEKNMTYLCDNLDIRNS